MQPCGKASPSDSLFPGAEAISLLSTAIGPLKNRTGTQDGRKPPCFKVSCSSQSRFSTGCDGRTSGSPNPKIRQVPSIHRPIKTQGRWNFAGRQSCADSGGNASTLDLPVVNRSNVDQLRLASSAKNAQHCRDAVRGTRDDRPTIGRFRNCIRQISHRRG